MLDALLEFADQTAHDIPTLGPADFDVALAVDPYDRIVANPGLFQVIVMQFVFADNSIEGGTRHFNERHRRTSFMLINFAWSAR